MAPRARVELDDEVPELDADAAAEVLFGPHAVTFDEQERHWAAWALFRQLIEANPIGELEALVTRVLELHSDDGDGGCAGCGFTEGGYRVAIADCPTLRTLP
jgi:hypothetical protein